MTPKGWKRLNRWITGLGLLAAVVVQPPAASGQGIMDRIRQKAQDKVQEKSDSLQATRSAKLDSLSQGVVDKATGAVECLVTNSGCIKRAFAKGKTVELVDSTGKAATPNDSAKAVATAGGVPLNLGGQAASASAAATNTVNDATSQASARANDVTSGGTPMIPGSGPFEGTIMLQTFSDAGTAMDLPYQMKGGKMRVDFTGSGGQSGSVIMDPANRRSIMLMPAQRMYMENAFQPDAPSATSNNGRDFVFTGQHEVIANYPCDDARYTDSDGKPVNVCLAKGLGGFLQPQMGGGARGRGGRSGGPNFGAEMFPLKVVKDGKLDLQVTSIMRQSLDASLFEIPAGYQKFGGRP